MGCLLLLMFGCADADTADTVVGAHTCEVVTNDTDTSGISDKVTDKVTDSITDDSNDDVVTDPPADTEKDDGTLKITEKDGKKILTYMGLKITTSKSADSGTIYGQVTDDSGSYSFSLNDGHIRAAEINKMDYFKYIEQLLDITIHTATYEDEKSIEISLGTEPNNLTNIYVENEKNILSVDGVLYRGSYKRDDETPLGVELTALLYFPAGRTGEYILPDGVKKICEGAFNATKLTKLVLNDDVTMTEGAFTNAPDTLIVVDGREEN